MSRPFRRWLIALVAFVVLAGGGVSYVFLAAGTTVEEAKRAVERFEEEDTRTTRSRRPLLAPVETGDAMPLYSQYLQNRAHLEHTAEERVRLALAAGRRSLTVAAGAVLDPNPTVEARRTFLHGHPVWRASTLVQWLGSDASLSRARGEHTDALRRATALLVAAHDACAFGRVDGLSLEQPLGAFEIMGRVLEAGRCDREDLATAASLLDALARMPIPSRVAAIPFAYLEQEASGALLVESPGARWLWSDTVARADAVRWLRSESDAVCVAWDGPPIALRSEILASVHRAKAVDVRSLSAAAYSGGSLGERLLSRALAWHESVALARAAIAVARFAEANGRLPATLADVMPAFLASVPVDPTTGRPIAYERGRVWAYGPDGDDDGGRAPPDDDDAAGGDGDLVWAVFDPAAPAPADTAAESTR